jgi:hypothetical protein
MGGHRHAAARAAWLLVALLATQPDQEFVAAEKERLIEQCWREGLEELSRAPDLSHGHGPAFDRLLKGCIESVLEPKTEDQ